MNTRFMARRRALVLFLGTVVGIVLLIAAASTSASRDQNPALLAAIWTPGDFYASTQVNAIGLSQPVTLRVQVNPPPGNAIIVHATDQNHRDIGTFVSQRTGGASSS